jgi:hypothetical protein
MMYVRTARPAANLWCCIPLSDGFLNGRLGSSAIAASLDERWVGSQCVIGFGALASFVLLTQGAIHHHQNKEVQWQRPITPGASFSGARGFGGERIR